MMTNYKVIQIQTDASLFEYLIAVRTEHRDVYLISNHNSQYSTTM